VSKELELAAMDAVGALTRRGKIKPAHAHANCLNCGAHLQGGYCHVCGQSADDHHRSIVHLAWEAVEGFTHLDGRLARTVPALLLRPGGLARDHIEGRRTRHVPPFRLFLICLLIFMFVMEAQAHRQLEHTHVSSPATKAAAAKAAGEVGKASNGQARAVTDAPDMTKAFGQIHSQDRLSTWLKPRLLRAVANREFYLMLVFQWGHRLAILMLPILAGLLTALYAYKRQFYVYDHLVVSMQFLSFSFLLWGAIAALPAWLAGWLFTPALIWTPVNLFMTLRGAYGSSVLGAAGKALFLWLASVVLFSILLIGLLALALNQV
jgi:hypothetical protein